MKKMLIRLRFAQLALSRVFKLNLGDKVYYNDMVWAIANGTTRPVWDLRTLNLHKRVHESNFKKVKSLSNYWHSFSSTYNFYMTSWYTILLHKPTVVLFDVPIHGWLKERK